jgi:hypothetical protein
MRVKLQLVLCDNDGQEETVTDVVTLFKRWYPDMQVEELADAA